MGNGMQGGPVGRDGADPVERPRTYTLLARTAPAGAWLDTYLGGLMSRLLVRVGLPALAVLALAGCGSSSKTTSSSSTAPTSTSATATAVDPAIAATVPAKIKTKGTLNVASEAQYAPNEFIAPDGHTVIGMDADLIRALAAVMGLKVNIINSNFETIIPGLAAGRYDIGMSSFTDTKEREKTVDFVTYFQAGISFYSKTSTNS